MSVSVNQGILEGEGRRRSIPYYQKAMFNLLTLKRKIAEK